LSNNREYPIPANEVQRLKAVLSYDVLDTPPEVDFDALTRIASHSLDTPAAVVGLLDADRLWFKSRLGLDAPQLDRDIAFCAHAIMQPGKLLVVEDLSQDSRFKDNPLVMSAPYLRFYAGAPLVDPNGLALGTIAVADIKPRDFSRKQGDVLNDLSVLAMTVLENRRRAHMLGRLAMTDYLTGLANRAQFDRALETELAHAKRTGEPFTLLCMDLDGFKAINDRYGHVAGDEVLCETARRLEEQARSEDIVSRIGGDEFSMIMRSASRDSARMLAKRISETISAPIVLSSGDRVGVGISIGMVDYSDTMDSAVTMLAQADSALYQVKRQPDRGGHHAPVG
jgi:diguanylate cyclase (GGDEF)-like protein